MDDLKKYVELCEAQQRSIDNYARVINALKDDFDKLQGAVLAEREVKPNLSLFFKVSNYLSNEDNPFLFLHRECINPKNNRINSIEQNLRLIFDGETGELKSAEVLK